MGGHTSPADRMLQQVAEAARSMGAESMELHAHNGVVVIDDTGAGDPTSTAASLRTLAVIGSEGYRTTAVLGELDLPGAAGDELLWREAHDAIGRLIVRFNIRMLVVVGQNARHIHNAAGLEGSWNGESVLVDTVQQAYDLLRDGLGDGDVVLVRSHSVAAEPRLADRLAASLGAAAPNDKAEGEKAL